MHLLDDTSALNPDVFEVHARCQPDQKAVVCGPVRRRWVDFNANINRVAHALQARGIGHGQQVAVLMGNAVEMLGETPLALVIRRPDATQDAESIQAWVNQRLARHQRLAALEFRDDFPRNALGKVLKRLLREPYWAASGRAI